MPAQIFSLQGELTQPVAKVTWCTIWQYESKIVHEHHLNAESTLLQTKMVGEGIRSGTLVRIPKHILARNGKADKVKSQEMIGAAQTDEATQSHSQA